MITPVPNEPRVAIVLLAHSAVTAQPRAEMAALAAASTTSPTP